MFQPNPRSFFSLLPLLTLLLQFLHHTHVIADVRLPPRITKSPGSHKFYRPNDDIPLECEAEGVPKPEFSWLFNQQPLTTGNVQIRRPGLIEINSANSFNVGTYQCLAENQYGTAISNVTHLVLAVLASYGANKDVFESKELNEGTPFVLRCVQTKSVPKPTYSWAIAASSEDSRNEDVICDKRVQMDAEGSLHFSYLQTSDYRDGKLYKCNLHNPPLDTTIGGSYSRVNVKAIPGGIKPFAPTLLFDTEQNQVAIEGRNISLRCFFAAYPEPSVRWYRQSDKGQMISMPLSRTEIKVYNYELIITNVQENDGGQYFCEASNTQGRVTHNFNVEIEAAPIFQDYRKRPHNRNVTEGQNVVFNCDAYAKPKPSIRWFKNAMLLDPYNLPAKYHLSPDAKQLSIDNLCKDCVGQMESSDLTVIQCEAANKHGTSFTDGYLNIIKKTEIIKGLPERIEIKKDGEIMSVQMNCESISDDATPVTTRWFYERPVKEPVFVSIYPIANKILLSRDNTTLTIMVKNASEWDEHGGRYKCNATNQYSSQVSVTNVQVIDLERYTEAPVVVGASSASALWWLLLLVAAILLLLILLICCCICCYRNRGDVYMVDKKERKSGNDPLKEIKSSGFHDFQRPAGDALKGSRASMGSSIKMDSDDEESLNAYGDIDAGKFGEDGSFIGDYATNDRRNNYQRV